MTDWYSTPFRKYDPSLGRFHGVDKLAEWNMTVGPGQFAYNNPINRNDPTGLDSPDGDEENGGDSGLGPCNCALSRNYGRRGGQSAIAGSGGHWTDFAWDIIGGVQDFLRNSNMMTRSTFAIFYGKSVQEKRFDVAKNESRGLSNSEMIDVTGELGWKITEDGRLVYYASEAGTWNVDISFLQRMQQSNGSELGPRDPTHSEQLEMEAAEVIYLEQVYENFIKIAHNDPRSPWNQEGQSTVKYKLLGAWEASGDNIIGNGSSTYGYSWRKQMLLRTGNSSLHNELLQMAHDFTFASYTTEWWKNMTWEEKLKKKVIE